MQPKLTVSGYRGIWGETLTAEIAKDFVHSFVHFIQKRGGTKILVGRDGRASGPILMQAIISELTSLGISVVDLGMMPTPTVLFLVQQKHGDGAIIITASHNPIEYNGLKFVTSSGLFTTESEVREIQNMRGNTFPQSVIRGKIIDGTKLFQSHLDAIVQHIDVPAIQAASFMVALDPINSVGCTTTPLLFDALGVTAEIINGTPTGAFTHEPEPLPKNLGDLQAIAREHSCAVGFAQDPDGDRLVLCDETGTLLSEELTLALAMKALLIKTPGDIVINLSTSNMSADIAESYGKKTIRSKVGEANVVEAMQQSQAIAGGEGGGGVIWPLVNTARDSFIGIALVLELMAHEQRPLSEIVASLPQYIMKKEKVSFSGDLPAMYEKIATLFPGAQSNLLDGLRLDFPDRSWIHIRPSNTEPVVRIIGESLQKERLEGLFETVRAVLN